MDAKILGFDLVSFTDERTGEVINGTRVYYEMLRDQTDTEFGSSCGMKFIKNCIPLQVGGTYEVVLKPVRKNGVVTYDVGGFAPLSFG